MALVNGATYRFENRADGERSLNVFGYSPSNLANICLYDSQDSDICQQWIYREQSGHAYLECKGKGAYGEKLYLDRYTGSNGGYNVINFNAHAYDEITDTCYIVIENAGAGYVRIRTEDRVNLGNRGTNFMYLTANQNANGTSAGKDVNAPGNVYFYDEVLSDDSQDWLPIRLDGGTDPDPEPEPEPENPYADLGWRYVFRTSTGDDDISNANGNFCYDPTGSVPPETHKHMGIDVICAEGTNLYSPASGTVIAYGGKPFVAVGDAATTVPSDTPPENRYEGGRGYFIVLEMDQKDPITNKTMYIRYLHMKSLPNAYVGKRVTSSTILGQVGNTGQSDTPHLHLDVTTMPLSSLPWNGDYQTAANMINPVNFFPEVEFPSSYYVVDSYV